MELNYRTDAAYEEGSGRMGAGQTLGPSHLMAITQKLAVDFYKAHGYAADMTHDFRNSSHPQERLMWDMACRAMEVTRFCDMEDVAAEYDDMMDEIG